LIDAPYHLTFSAIAELTDRQIYDIYYRARDRDGAPEPIEDPQAEWQRKEVKEDANSPEQKAKSYSQFMSMAATFGMNLATAQKKWDEAQAKNGT
jgi:hypothetical protein